MAQQDVDKLVSQEYKLGFTVDVEEETVAPGLNDEVIRFISAKKEEPEWMTELRIKALQRWEKMQEPHWSHLHYDPIDYQAISYFAAPKKAPNSLDEVDANILEAYEKLGIPLEEQTMLQGIAVDAVFDSVSVKTTYSETQNELSIIFCSISAVESSPSSNLCVSPGRRTNGDINGRSASRPKTSAIRAASLSATMPLLDTVGLGPSGLIKPTRLYFLSAMYMSERLVVVLPLFWPVAATKIFRAIITP